MISLLEDFSFSSEWFHLINCLHGACGPVAQTPAFCCFLKSSSWACYTRAEFRPSGRQVAAWACDFGKWILCGSGKWKSGRAAVIKGKTQRWEGPTAWRKDLEAEGLSKFWGFSWPTSAGNSFRHCFFFLCASGSIVLIVLIRSVLVAWELWPFLQCTDCGSSSWSGGKILEEHRDGISSWTHTRSQWLVSVLKKKPFS